MMEAEIYPYSDLAELEAKLFEIDPKAESANILRLLVAYMEKRGLVFRKINYEDSSPYAILNGDTSVGYRKRMDGNTLKNKIVLYCGSDGVDSSRICASMGKKWSKNSDKYRPFRIIFEPEEFPEAVSILLENSLNR